MHIFFFLFFFVWTALTCIHPLFDVAGCLLLLNGATGAICKILHHHQRICHMNMYHARTIPHAMPCICVWFIALFIHSHTYYLGQLIINWYRFRPLLSTYMAEFMFYRNGCVHSNSYAVQYGFVVACTGNVYISKSQNRAAAVTTPSFPIIHQLSLKPTTAG